MEVSTTTVTGSPTTTASTGTSSGLASSSSTDDSRPDSFVGNAPSTVLFFLALAVGVFIASLFIFFTVRYFIRAKYGLHIYPVAQRNMFLSNNIATMNHTNIELQEQLNYVRANNFITSDMFDRRLHQRLRRRRRRRRRDRFSKMKKLTETEVETLFPKKTYYDWLNGGQERDHENRDGVLHEEGDGENNVDKVEETSSNDTSATSDEAGPSTSDYPTNDVEMTELAHAPSEEQLHFTSGSCAICLDHIEDEDIVRGLVCGHVFHADCLDPWLTKRRACCPMCKRDYYYKGNQNGENEADSNDAATNTGDTQANNRDSTASGGDTGATATENGAPDNSDDQTNANDLNRTGEQNEEDDMGDDTDSIDIELFRNDPTLRAMLQELIPINERVQMILRDETLQHLNLDATGLEVAKRKRSNIFKIIFWKVMGITRDDLYNYGVLTAYHKYRLAEERRQFEEQQNNQNNRSSNEAERSETATEQQGQTSEGEPHPILPSHDSSANGNESSVIEVDLAENSGVNTLPIPSNQSQRSLSVVSIQTAPTHISARESSPNPDISPESLREASENRV